MLKSKGMACVDSIGYFLHFIPSEDAIRSMKQQITFRQYRGMDVGIFTVLLCLCETLITLAATRWFPGEPYTLSITPAVTAIVMVRWGIWAAIPAFMGALTFCVASGATAAQYLIYCGGNLAAMVMLVYLRRFDWKRLRDQVLLAFLYGLMTALTMQLGRGLIALVLGTPVATCAGFITTDTLSALFAVLIVWIAKRLDGMLEEQKHYLLRVEEEQKREKARGNDPWQD